MALKAQGYVLVTVIINLRSVRSLDRSFNVRATASAARPLPALPRMSVGAGFL